jgi:glycosyltransferase involved in cell wall biosynthesis
MRRGVETLTISLANELSRMGVKVSILTARQIIEPLINPDPMVHVYQFPTFRYYETRTIIPFYVNCLRKIRPDVVVTFFADFGEGRTIQLSRLFFQLKHILYLTFPYESAPHRYKAYQVWGWDKTVDLILADAKYTADRGGEILGRPVQVLPSGTDPQSFHPDEERRKKMRNLLGYQDEDVILLNVSALEERKGTWRVIEALPDIRKKIPQVRYLILGEGLHRSVLEQHVRKLSLENIVVFYGTTNDLPPIYNAADIFIMLSDSEAGSVALLEAMASGIPVIVSRSGGFTEIVNPKNGIVINHENPVEIVNSISKLASSTSVRLNLGKKGCEFIRKKYSWEMLANKLIEYIANIYENKLV